VTLSITINLPVKDVARSSTFFANLGFVINPLYANEEHMELLGISDEVNVMLVSESRFKSITGKEIADAAHHAEAIMQLRVESKERVDELVDKALAGGGGPLHETNDQGFLYGRSFQDLDSHNWDAFYVDETAMRS
jgi:predicted lactoylglutathione lyase